MEWLRLTSLSCSLAASFFQSRPANDAQISVSQNTPKLKISQTFKTVHNPLSAFKVATDEAAAHTEKWHQVDLQVTRGIVCEILGINVRLQGHVLQGTRLSSN